MCCCFSYLSANRIELELNACQELKVFKIIIIIIKMTKRKFQQNSQNHPTKKNILYLQPCIDTENCQTDTLTYLAHSVFNCGLL